MKDTGCPVGGSHGGTCFRTGTGHLSPIIYGTSFCPLLPGCKEEGLTLTSARAEKTAMTVLLEAQGADLTARQLRTFLTATDVTAMLILPG